MQAGDNQLTPAAILHAVVQGPACFSSHVSSHGKRTTTELCEKRRGIEGEWYVTSFIRGKQ
jgi:hypothetical protein